MSDVTPFSNIAAPLIGSAHFPYAPFDVQSQFKFWNLEMIERAILPKVAASAQDASFIVMELPEGFFECMDGLVVTRDVLLRRSSET